jgi:hypothetical protein
VARGRVGEELPNGPALGLGLGEDRSCWRGLHLWNQDMLHYQHCEAGGQQDSKAEKACSVWEGWLQLSGSNGGVGGAGSGSVCIHPRKGCNH